MATLRIDSRGRIVLPRHIRDSLGVEPGACLSAEVEGSTLRLAAAPAPEVSKLVEHALAEMRRGATTSLRDFAREQG